MFDKEITFDRFIRGIIFIAGAIIIGWLINRLSTVLLPFFIAWLLAYMLYPLVCFLQYRCRLKNRVFSILVAILLVLAVITGIMVLVIPPTIEEFARLSDIISVYAQEFLGQTNLPQHIQRFVHDYIEGNSDSQSLLTLFQQSSFMEAAEAILTKHGTSLLEQSTWRLECWGFSLYYCICSLS